MIPPVLSADIGEQIHDIYIYMHYIYIYICIHIHSHIHTHVGIHIYLYIYICLTNILYRSILGMALPLQLLPPGRSSASGRNLRLGVPPTPGFWSVGVLVGMPLAGSGRGLNTVGA